MSLLLLVLVTFFKVSIAIAEPICSDFSQLNSNKENFPVFLQSLPLLLTMDNLGAKVAIRLRVVENKLKTEFNIKSILGDDYKDDSYIKKICKDGEKYRFYFENNSLSKKGKEPQIEIQEKNSKIFLTGHEIKKTNSADFDKVWAAADERRNAPTKSSTPTIFGGSK